MKGTSDGRYKHMQVDIYYDIVGKIRQTPI